MANIESADTNFQYWEKGKKSSTKRWVSVERSTTTPDEFTAQVSGLDPGTTYVVTAIGYSDSTGWQRGTTVEFTTDSEPYTVQVENPRNVGATSATLVGDLTQLSGVSAADTNLQYWEKGKKSSTQQWLSVETGTTSPGEFTAEVNDLDPGTTYVVTAIGYSDSAGWQRGTTVEFTTDSEPYTVQVENPRNVGATSATLVGNLTHLSGVSAADTNLQYWEKGNKSSTRQWVSVETGTSTADEFTAQVSGLDPGTTYVVTAIGYSDSAGWQTGGTTTFTTDSQPYTIQVENPRNLGATSATLVGNLTQLSGVSEADTNFQYWVQGKKSSTRQWVSVETGTSTADEFTAQVAGLQAGTTYVVTAIGFNSQASWQTGGTTTFTTESQPYSIQVDNPRNVGATSATLVGNLTHLSGVSQADTNLQYWEKGKKSSTRQWLSVETGTSTADEFTAQVSGLDPGTTYVVTAIGFNSQAGWQTGGTTTFTTDSQPYSIQVESPRNVGATSATLVGNLMQLSGVSAADTNFQYWEKDERSSTRSWVSVETGTSTADEFSTHVSGLDPGTTYVVTAIGFHSQAGWQTGGTTTFTTASQPYSIKTTGVRNVGTTSATLVGDLPQLSGVSEVDTNFQYWEKGEKSSTRSWVSVETETSTADEFTAQASGLKADTTYVVVAIGYSDSAGWQTGAPVEFTTGRATTSANAESLSATTSTPPATATTTPTSTSTRTPAVTGTPAQTATPAPTETSTTVQESTPTETDTQTQRSTPTLTSTATVPATSTVTSIPTSTVTSTTPSTTTGAPASTTRTNETSS
jgi:uncharacterized membrane protein